MKYILKSLVVGYEVPLLDLDDKSGQDQLIEEINHSLTSYDEVVGSYMDTVELHTSNLLFKLVYILKFNVGDMTIDKMNEHFNDLKSKFENAMENFLKSRGIFYVKIDTN